MKLRFLHNPVTDLAEADAFYRDVLGWEEAWREGDDTIAFQIPDSDIQVMLSVDPDPAGPMYEVDDLERYLAETPELTVTTPPRPIPDGAVAGLVDPAGNAWFVFDQHPEE
ncbi:MAG: VOC family protein [Leifsonia flava]